MIYCPKSSTFKVNFPYFSLVLIKLDHYCQLSFVKISNEFENQSEKHKFKDYLMKVSFALGFRSVYDWLGGLGSVFNLGGYSHVIWSCFSPWEAALFLYLRLYLRLWNFYFSRRLWNFSFNRRLWFFTFNRRRLWFFSFRRRL